MCSCGNRQKLANDLYLESFRDSTPVLAEMADALDHMGLNLSVWDGVQRVANASSIVSEPCRDMHPGLLRSMVMNGALPDDFHSCNATMTCMQAWLDSVM